jgi:hypothetical protein
VVERSCANAAMAPPALRSRSLANGDVARCTASNVAITPMVRAASFARRVKPCCGHTMLEFVDI